MTQTPSPPPYERGSLADVLPAVAASLGVAPAPARSAPLTLPPARRAVTVLIDGMGAQLLARRSGHAPWLRTLLGTTQTLASGFPSTTATSMGTFGTGLVPGAHGLLGYEVLDPARGQVLNELSWEDGPVPERWQPRETVFERAAAAGVSVAMVGPGFFDGSGLTRAALRGARFVAADPLEARVDAALAAVGRDDRALVHLYWGDLDKVGHVHGCESWQWGDELERVDRELARLAAGLPPGTSLTVTADHGMVDCPEELRLDMALEPALAAGVRVVAGEPRAPQLHVEPGAAADVVAAWRERLGERAWVATREEAVAAGWFGPPETLDRSHLARVGDVVAPMRDRCAVVDSRHHRPELIALVGLHGSLSSTEVDVPLLHVPADGLGDARG